MLIRIFERSLIDLALTYLARSLSLAMYLSIAWDPASLSAALTSGMDARARITISIFRSIPKSRINGAI